MQAQSQSQTVQLRCYFHVFMYSLYILPHCFCMSRPLPSMGHVFFSPPVPKICWPHGVQASTIRYLCVMRRTAPDFIWFRGEGREKKKRRNTSGFLGRSFVVFPFALAAAHFGDRALSLTIFLVLYAERRIVHIVLHKNLPHTWQRLHDQSLDVAIPHHRNTYT